LGSVKCREKAAIVSKALATSDFKSQAVKLSENYIRLQGSLSMLLAYQVQIEAELKEIRTFSTNYSTIMSDFNSALSLVTSTSTSLEMHCTKKELA
jgi:hypothetical protein